MSKEKRDIPISMDKTVEEILSFLSSGLSIAKTRLERFVDEFNRDFADDEIEDKASAETMTWALMDSPLILYAPQLNGSVIIELFGMLERFALRDVTDYLVPPSKRGVAFRVLGRCSLSDTAAILQDLGIFDKKDMKFVEKLTALRNGLAHKNPRRISNMLLSGKGISVLDIDSVMVEFDCIPLMIKTIRLMVKMEGASIGK